MIIKRGKAFWPSADIKKIAWISNEKIYKEAEKNPVLFWEKAAEQLSWNKKWEEAYEEKLPHFKWFVDGKMNACFNCIDKHLPKNANKKAIIWQGEPENETREITYQKLYDEVNKVANVLKNLGVKKNDRVAIYLPMVPEIIFAMLACARIGAIHAVVFSAFSSEALKTRLLDSEAKLLITADGYYRRGKIINLKQEADAALQGTKIKKVIIMKRAGNEISMKEKRDFFYDELMKSAKDYCKPEKMDSEDILFLLYTSGSTGKPKGVFHSTAGYLLQAFLTTKLDFDLHDEDIFWCTADLGWITGHTYCCYGPLSNGATIFMFEGVPDYPNADRWFQLIEKYKINIFYTAPTAIRMLMLYGNENVKKHDLSSLRILGTVGEPINEEAWLWYFNVIGEKKCPVIDTWWQTETGGTLINALPGIGPFIPCYAGRSFPGTRHAVFDEKGKKVLNKEGNLVQLSPFAPGMLRGIWHDEKKYKETYWSQYKNAYFTSDAAFQDKQGNFRLLGRTDDVIKVAGHRLSTAEMENAINKHESVVESAVVGMPHAIKGEVPVAFAVSKERTTETEKEIIALVEKKISKIARPEKIYFVSELPKTRSGKIMRRILKKLLRKEDVGDLTTLANPESVKKIKKILQE